MSYFAIPFRPVPERADVVSKIMREMIKFETIFTDYTKSCGSVCGECDECARALAAAARALAHAEARVWEVWDVDAESRLVGVMMLSSIVPGCDAEAHYIFFDGKLKDKAALIENVIGWCFEPHENWLPLARITIAVPDYAFSLARHAQKHLGFGGNFTYTSGNSHLAVEGVKRSAFRWRGKDRDILILGRVK